MKGFFHTLEAILAIIMILGILAFLFHAPRTKPEFVFANYKLQAYNDLKTLDGTGQLRLYTLNNNSDGIKDALSVCSKISCKVVIYDKDTNLTEGLSGDIIGSITSVSYIISGNTGEYKPREVRLYMWGLTN